MSIDKTYKQLSGSMQLRGCARGMCSIATALVRSSNKRLCFNVHRFAYDESREDDACLVIPSSSLTEQ